MIRVTGRISIAEDEIREEYTRSAGPGGQHVNKAETAVQLRFNVDASPNLPQPVKERLKALAGRRLTTAGEIVITSRETRSRERNREEALGRLLGLIREAAAAPKARRPTKPTRSSKERRLKEKSLAGARKRMRRRGGDE